MTPLHVLLLSSLEAGTCPLASILSGPAGDASQAPFLLSHVDNVAEALGQLGNRHFDIVLFESGEEDADCAETLQSLRRGGSSIPVLVIADCPGTAARWLSAGADDVALKGSLDDCLFPERMRRAVDRREREAEFDSARMQLEDQTEQLGRMYEEITRLRQDLDEVTGAVLHDLQEPARAMLAESRWVREQIEALDRWHVTPSLEGISTLAHNIEQGCAHILAYQHGLGSRPQPREVDLAGVIDHTMDKLELAPTQRQRVRVAGSLPSLAANELMLEELFESLLMLCLRRREVAERVEISARDGQVPVLSILATGIDLLRNESAHLPLTVARRVVHWHSGRLWMQREGDGTRIQFTLSPNRQTLIDDVQLPGMELELDDLATV